MLSKAFVVANETYGKSKEGSDGNVCVLNNGEWGV